MLLLILIVATPVASGAETSVTEDLALLRLGASGPLPVERVFPEIDKADLACLRAQRPKYDRVTATQRLAAQGKFEEALQTAAALMDEAPEFGPGIDAYVDIAATMKRLDEAADRFNARGHQAPNHWNGWYGLAKVRLAMKAPDVALQSVRRAIDEGCDHWGGFEALADVSEPGEGLDLIGKTFEPDTDLIDGGAIGALEETDAGGKFLLRCHLTLSTSPVSCCRAMGCQWDATA